MTTHTCATYICIPTAVHYLWLLYSGESTNVCNWDTIIWGYERPNPSVQVCLGLRRRGHTDKYTDLFSPALSAFWGWARAMEAAGADSDLYLYSKAAGSGLELLSVCQAPPALSEYFFFLNGVFQIKIWGNSKSIKKASTRCVLCLGIPVIFMFGFDHPAAQSHRLWPWIAIMVSFHKNPKLPKHWLAWTESSKEMTGQVVNYSLSFWQSGYRDVLAAFRAVWSNLFLLYTVVTWQRAGEPIQRARDNHGFLGYAAISSLL